MKIYDSEIGEHPFPRSARNLEALATFRGAYAGVEFAEAFQLLIYPCNEIEMQYPSATEFGEGFGLTTKSMRWFWDKYLPNLDQQSDPYAVPARATDLKGVAAAIVIAAQFDPLTDDARLYYQKLVTNSVPAIYKEYGGQIHGFFNLSGVTEDANLLYSDIAFEINAILGRGK